MLEFLTDIVVAKQTELSEHFILNLHFFLSHITFETMLEENISWQGANAVIKNTSPMTDSLVYFCSVDYSSGSYMSSVESTCKGVYSKLSYHYENAELRKL
jgi:hypothetical protein